MRQTEEYAANITLAIWRGDTRATFLRFAMVGELKKNLLKFIAGVE